jgi:acetyl esterase
MTRLFLAFVRLLPDSVLEKADLPVGELAVDRKFRIAGPAGKIRVRLFDPRAEREPGPVVVFYHGGGFCVGSSATHASLAADIARSLDLPVYSVDYRLAPGSPWPAAPDDAEAAARWIAGNVPATALILAGDSAGGNLALVAALALRDDPAAVPVAGQVLLYPAVDTQGDYPSRAEFAGGYGLDKADMVLFERHYRGDAASWRHSPLKADLAGLAPTVLATASLDPLRDEGRALAGKLEASGCGLTYLELDGTIHGFATFRRAIPSANEDLSRVLAAAREAF